MTELSGTVMVETFRLAKLQVKEDIRAKGLRLKDYEAKDISNLAWSWFLEHRAELIGQATIGLLCARGSVRIPTRLRTLSDRQASKAKELSR